MLLKFSTFIILQVLIQELQAICDISKCRIPVYTENEICKGLNKIDMCLDELLINNNDCLLNEEYKLKKESIAQEQMKAKCEKTSNNNEILKINVYAAPPRRITENVIHEIYDHECKLASEYLNCNFAYNNQTSYLFKNKIYKTDVAENNDELTTILVDNLYSNVQVDTRHHKMKIVLKKGNCFDETYDYTINLQDPMKHRFDNDILLLSKFNNFRQKEMYMIHVQIVDLKILFEKSPNSSTFIISIEIPEIYENKEDHESKGVCFERQNMKGSSYKVPQRNSLRKTINLRCGSVEDRDMRNLCAQNIYFKSLIKKRPILNVKALKSSSFHSRAESSNNVGCSNFSKINELIAIYCALVVMLNSFYF